MQRSHGYWDRIWAPVLPWLWVEAPLQQVVGWVLSKGVRTLGDRGEPLCLFVVAF